VSAPVIGICAALERVRWAAWDVEANLIQRSYSEAVAAAGALAIVLPPAESAAASPDGLLDLVDGLILAGGSDLDPASYGAEQLAETKGARPERDRFELALARRALERDLPVLGICRGMELLNVALGGTLEQSLPQAQIHLHTPGVFTDHEVRLEPGSLAARAIGSELINVRSHHHQGIGELGDGLAVSGHSVPDGIVEAIELPDRRWALGVLWHTEEERRSPVIEALVGAAREHAPGTSTNAPEVAA
jgi:putative glutamine amidotransferase